jgi:hypothetical protein
MPHRSCPRALRQPTMEGLQKYCQHRPQAPRKCHARGREVVDVLQRRAHAHAHAISSTAFHMSVPLQRSPTFWSGRSGRPFATGTADRGLRSHCSTMATFTTVAFDHSRLRWVEIHPIAELQGPSFISRTVARRGSPRDARDRTLNRYREHTNFWRGLRENWQIVTANRAPYTGKNLRVARHIVRTGTYNGHAGPVTSLARWAGLEWD